MWRVSYVSIHAFREGRRLAKKYGDFGCFLSFNPRLPRGKATFFRTWEPRGTRVSIHAFREGRRRNRAEKPAEPRGFNPRLPRGKATRCRICRASIQRSFNPRLPRGKATWQECSQTRHAMCFNPRLPRGKATSPLSKTHLKRFVSIHAFREGRRHSMISFLFMYCAFQSTPSAREGDAPTLSLMPVATVSIHAFREGRRLPSPKRQSTGAEVSIHAFREGRRLCGITESELEEMVSIHAFREGRRPNRCSVQPAPTAVSIHAFREGRRPYIDLARSWIELFQSTPSAREGDPVRWS